MQSTARPEALTGAAPRPPSSREGDRPQAVEGVSPIICPTCAACAGHMIFFVSGKFWAGWAGRTGRAAGQRHERRFFGTNDPSAPIRRRTDCGIIGVRGLREKTVSSRILLKKRNRNKKTVLNGISRIHKFEILCYNWEKVAGRRTKCPENECYRNMTKTRKSGAKT